VFSRSDQGGTTRRAFLGTTLAAASPLILPSRVFGQNAPSKRITVGMIGCGRWGSKINLDPFLAMPDVTVVAVCDVDSWRMDFTRQKINDHYAKSAVSGSYKGCKAYADFRELLADPGIDAVMVSTCDHWHVPDRPRRGAGRQGCLGRKTDLAEHRGGPPAGGRSRRLGRVTRNDSEFRGDARMRLAAEAVREWAHRQAPQASNTTVPARAMSPLRPVATADPVPKAGLDYDLWLGPCPEAPYITAPRPRPPEDSSGRTGCACRATARA
jgi:myo-inositol 2-dehydrogenase / D-chiro-inositol 1-dehydrogenase